jgi:hypothetical protein
MRKPRSVYITLTEDAKLLLATFREHGEKGFYCFTATGTIRDLAINQLLDLGLIAWAGESWTYRITAAGKTFRESGGHALS